MKVHQLLYGYRDGHRRLASSIDLEESLNWDLVRTTDRPSIPDKLLDQGITFGLPISNEFYALCRTWSAREIERPGAVWSHVLLLPTEIDSPINYLYLLHDINLPDINQFNEPITVNSSENTLTNEELSVEAARLLLLLSATPRAGVRAYSESSPLEVLSNAQKHCRGILKNQAFSTSIGKKDIENNKNSVILTPEDKINESTITWKCLLDKDFESDSERVNQAWKLLKYNDKTLQHWLSTMLYSLKKQSTSELKLVMEAILLGQGILDDVKLLKRMINAVDDVNTSPLVSYALGKNFSSVEAPPRWISSLYFLTVNDWEKWTSLIDEKEVGLLAAKAPCNQLANALENSATSRSVKSAINTLAHALDKESFISISKISEPATELLISNNRELLFFLPSSNNRKEKYAATSIGKNQKNILGDLQLLSLAPFFWESIIANRIRKSRSKSELISFASDTIEEGKWTGLSSTARKFLKKTPDFIAGLLEIRVSKKTLNTIDIEFDHWKTSKALTSFITKNRYRIEEVSKTIVDTYGPDAQIDIINNLPSEVKTITIATLSDERWQKSHSEAVFTRIKEDVSSADDPLIAIKMINDRTLHALLDKAYNQE